MKNVLIILCLIFTATISTNAQPPQGGRGDGRPGGPPSGRMMREFSSDVEKRPILEAFPDIPNLTLEQRERVGSILTKEKESIVTQLNKKRDLEIKSREDLTEKQLEKDKKELDKIDKKIAEIKTKSNKKIKKELSEEQYLVFLEKREEFKFKYQGEGNHNSRRKKDLPQPPSEDHPFDNMFD